MKSSLLNAMGLVTATATNVFAATGAREDSSGLLVWIFLGFCALIVVAQLIPAILMFSGMLKVFVGKKEGVAVAHK